MILANTVSTAFKNLFKISLNGALRRKKTTSKCSHSLSMLRFFGGFSLALHPLIEILSRL